MALEARAVILEGLHNGRTMLSALRDTSPSQRTYLKSLEAQELAMLGLSSVAQIRDLTSNPTAKQEAERKSLEFFINCYGIPGGEKAVKDTISKYSKDADSVIDKYREAEFKSFALRFEMMSEVRNATNIVDLLILINTSINPRVQFEASRKLYLIHLAANNDQIDRDEKSLSLFKGFDRFIKEKVFNSLGKSLPEEICLVSEHDEESFEIKHQDKSHPKKPRIREVAAKDLKDIPSIPGQKITILPVRSFRNEHGEDIPVYSKDREKGTVDQILKLVRKGEDNPSKGIQDRYGLMFVVPTEKDVNSLRNKLIRESVDNDYAFGIESVEDNLKGGQRKDHARAGAPNLAMLKFIANVGGVRIEIMFHTYESYLNSRNKKGHAYAEYEVRRQTHPDVVNLLFPHFMYGVDFEKETPGIIKRVREEIEDPKTGGT